MLPLKYWWKHIKRLVYDSDDPEQDVLVDAENEGERDEEEYIWTCI